MARRRHYRGLVRFPGLGRLSMPSSVKPLDVVVGGLLGAIGSVGLQIGASKAIAAGLPIPSAVASGSPVVGGLTTGGVLYLAQKKKNPTRAAGHALGAALAGAGVWLFGVVQGLVAAASPGTAATAGFGAPLFMNPRMQGYGFAPRTLPAGMGGPIFNNPNTNLARIGRLQGFGDENEDGLFPAP
jgi:hypothetical protein